MTPEEAFRYAHENGLSEKTRKIACEDSCYAYYYALCIDKCPGDDTREAACKDLLYAYRYARDVDKCPRDDTREAACKNPEYTYLYAIDIDKGFHEDTWEAVKNIKYEEDYKKFSHSKMKEEIL